MIYSHLNNGVLSSTRKLRLISCAVQRASRATSSQAMRMKRSKVSGILIGVDSTPTAAVMEKMGCEKSPQSGNYPVMSIDEAMIARCWLKQLILKIGWKPGEFRISDPGDRNDPLFYARELLRVSRTGYEPLYFDVDSVAEAACDDAGKAFAIERQLKRAHPQNRSAKTGFCMAP